MKAALIFLSLLVVFCLTGTASAGFFDWPCPPGCASSTCTSLGCSQCQAGYYVHLVNRVTICVSTCPKGYYKHPIGWCTKCGIRNCEDCSGKTTCTECSRRYELDGYGGCRRQ